MAHADARQAVSRPMLSRLADAVRSYSQRNWRLVVIAMLALLHVAVLRGVADPWARALLLAHLGLLLLWQPFVRAEQRVSPVQGLLLMLGAFLVMMRLDWWLLAFWVVVLAGLVGGKVYQNTARWQRRCYLVVFVYLLALLAVVILPEIAPGRQIDPEIRRYAEYALPLLFVLIGLFPTEEQPVESAQMIDFFYSLFLMLVLVVVILGSFTLMTLTRRPYLEALATTVLLVGGTVLLIALAWNPRSGFSGLNVFFSRYLFSIGLPVEKWLHFLAELSQLEARPDRFLTEGVAALAHLPWISGVTWRSSDPTTEQAGEEGAASEHAVEFENGALALKIYSRYRISPALSWHLHLLGLLLGEFYLAKLREERLRESSYMEAIHETGARLTHDIKNLLQSLNVLCAAATREEDRDSPEVRALLRRQLPVIAQRLAETLGKLQRPEPEADAYAGARDWWDALAQQYRAEGVEFSPPAIAAGARLPRSLFDNVADNLIRNALAKRAADDGLRVSVAFEAGKDLTFSVCDSGAAVPAHLEDTLLRGPINSGAGLGIGLYQAARLAESKGYRLALQTNQDGEVRFALRGPAA
jgi:signal transduction histidine kinase